jgi:hypothetical protein
MGSGAESARVAGRAADGVAMMDITHAELIEKYLRIGDTITHTRCCGFVEEHIYTGHDGPWLCGKPTKDTKRLGGLKSDVNDISPKNVTHINRNPVDGSLEYVAQFKDRR